MEQIKKHTCSLLLFDLSGFTQLIYQAGLSDEIMGQVLGAVRRMFLESGMSAKSCDNVKILVTTGDGFIAKASGEDSARTALEYAQLVHQQFKTHLQSAVHNLPFRQRIDLRVALHHGVFFEVPLDDNHGGYPLYIGDDLNLMARVVNSQTARRHAFALTRAFVELLTGKTMPEDPDEVIQDRNLYPEQIEIFSLPA